MARSGQNIFISYARDDVAFARDLRERLLALGHGPWMDLFDIPAGARWPSEIDRALKSSDIIIGLMSPAAVASENVMNEWDWAIANDRRLVLLLIEICEIPFHYVSRNYIDFVPGREAGYAQLEQALGGIDPQLAGQPRAEVVEIPVREASEAPPESSVSPAPSMGGSRLRRALTRRRPAPRLVGREAEQRRLQIALSDAQNSEGGLILLGGEAGIGKTTLTRWLMTQADERGALPLIGGCYDLATTPPYGPWIEILRAYEPSDGLPPLPEVISDEAQLATIPSQAALFEIIGEFFAEVGDHRPLLLILEDLHWADQATLDLLRFFARFLAGLPVLVIGTYRDDELTRRHLLFELLPSLAREEGASHLTLHRLEAADIQALVRDRYQLTQQDEKRLIDYLQRLSEGNPLFAGELLSALEEDRTLQQAAAGWRLQELTEGSVPPLLRQVIEGRLQRLDGEARELLEIAAVIGQEIPIDLWQNVSAVSTTELSAALSSAFSANLVDELPDGAGLAFRHALIREALYSSIAMIRRRELHRDVADALIAGPSPDPDEVVTHLDRAFDQRIFTWLLQAGDRAMSRFAWDVAIERFERAYELIERQAAPDPIERCEILLALGEAQNLVAAGRLGSEPGPALGGGGSYTGRDTFWQAAELAREKGTAEQLGRAALGYVGFNPYTNQGGSEGIWLLEEAINRLPDEDSPLRVRVLSRFSTEAYMRGALSEAIPLTEELEISILERSEAAIDMAKRLDDTDSLAYALVMQSILHDFFSDDDWLNIATQACSAAARSMDRSLLAWALSVRITALDSRGAIADQQTATAEYARVTEELDLPLFRFILAMRRAIFALAEGRLEEAQSRLYEAERIQPRTPVGLFVQLELDLERDVEDRVDKALSEMGNLTPRMARLNRALVYLKTGRQESAKQTYDTIDVDRELKRRIRRPLLAQLAEICASAGTSDQIKQLYDALLPYAGLNVYGEGSDIGGCVSYYLGLLAAAMERWDDAEKHYDEALRLNDQWGYRLHVTRTQYAWADMLLRRGRPGDRQQASELLDDAYATTTELGLVRLERLVTDLRGQLEAAPG